ncbi:hypothetical protein C9374_000180 [Naegleria lovaniensis]|uniref:Uncharacterized protein n=1 Tax=Naegleria lovaniensis TaxID=51637 RepID=A0AA88GUN6_NAELO|nr:uncharacterized protein C9374_000180 [Naegleria lovaniensis]KAG2388741.1 hypothetical protein C9374_000180 [Naegleria lovaniensis]
MNTAECIIGPRNQPKPIQENKKPTRENQLHSPGTDLGLFEMEEGVVSPFLNGISKQGQMSTQEDDILLEAEDEMENPSPRSTSLYHVMRELEKVKKENQQLKRTISELIRQQHSHQVL